MDRRQSVRDIIGHGGLMDGSVAKADSVDYSRLLARTVSNTSGPRAWASDRRSGCWLSLAISPQLLVAERAFTLAPFAAGKEEIAAVGGFERLGVAAGALAFGALVGGIHSKFPG